MAENYDPAAVEADAQQYWLTQQTFQAVEDPAREKFYCLAMFPYPSGRLHMGHVRNYTIGDVIARLQRMLGKNVLQPMGWDAFGLPAENAAQKHGVPPARWTYENIDYMRTQLQRLGFGYDWGRELATCHPKYYRWEQWLFTRLFRKGLVYRKTAPVNWCPHDQTVLANEQVIDGCCWRCDTPVERKEIPQWFMRITDYAEELLTELDNLPDWPEQVRTMQRNWIGRSEGVEVHFEVAGRAQPLKVFTTRPDTLMGVTYVAVAPEHPLAQAAAAQRPELAAFIEECRHQGTSEAALETMEKRGVDTGLQAVHPLTGAQVPIYAANFVLMGYGEGAVMAVPAHDQRDWEFARKYGLPIKQVIAPADGAAVDLTEGAFIEHGVLTDSGPFDGMDFAQAFDAIAARLQEDGRGQKRVTYRLRDWGVSRQRYWGAPIPIIHCERCGAVPVADDDLPVVLPEDVAWDGAGSPLQGSAAFLHAPCPQCGADARRETDTFDTFVESSWYFARFACADNDTAMLDERAQYWLPVDQYVGGIEHAILHLLYARFYNKLLRDAGLLTNDEPFTRLLTQGMVVAETYYRADNAGKRQYYGPEEIAPERDAKGRITAARLAADGEPVVVGGMEKMSKSKGNGVDPQALIERYGADTVRLFTMFTAPPEQSLEWNDDAVEGAARFLKKIWKLVTQEPNWGLLQGANPDAAPPDDLPEAYRDLRRELHELLQQAQRDAAKYQFNTVVAAGMKMVNALARLNPAEADGAPYRSVLVEGVGILLRILAPIVPHICHVLWQRLGYGDNILDAPWPQADEAALVRAAIELVVQVNGKVRGKITVAADATREQMEQAALADDNVQRFVADKTVRKLIVVPGKLVNVVVA